MSHKISSKLVLGFSAIALAVLLFAVGSATNSNAATAPGLGTSSSYAVLGGSTVTNTGASTVEGNLGVSPGSAVTGFPPGLVSNGAIHAADANALQAQTDLTNAYNVAAGAPCDVNLTGQDLGGMTLTEGTYCFSTSAQLTGALTLDAQGNAAAVFIFQIGSTLTTATNASVLVINGGIDCNAFWQVGSSATLGVQTTFVGNILALTSISLNTGADISGRALARNGAVTLDTNHIGFVACTPATPTAPPTPDVTPSPIPSAAGPTPVGQTPSPTPPPTPVGQTPSPTPVAPTAPPTPFVTAPPTPFVTAPPTPVGQTPSPTPVGQTPSPTPVGQTPSPTPVQTETPTPVFQTGSPTPVVETPTPTPGSPQLPPPAPTNSPSPSPALPHFPNTGGPPFVDGGVSPWVVLLGLSMMSLGAAAFLFGRKSQTNMTTS